MTELESNSKYLYILPPVSVDPYGWELRALSPTDYTTVMAYVPRFTELMLSKSANDLGAGSVTLDSEDPILHSPLPLGLPGTLLDHECLWQVHQDGILRGEWLGQDVQEDVVTEEGSLVTKISGQSTEGVLSWGVAVPGIVSRMLPDPKDKKAKSWNSKYRVFHGRRESNKVRLWITSGHGVKVGWPIYVWDLRSEFNGHATVTAKGKNWIEFSRSGSNISKFDDSNAYVQIHPSASDPKKPKEWTARLIPTDIVDPMEFLQQPGINSFLWLMNENIVPRGTLDFVTLLFDAEKDSEGQPWDDVSDVQVSAGETPLALLQRLSASFGWEFKMLPGFKLFISQGGFGTRREDQVKHFIAGTQLQHGRVATSRDVSNRVYVQAQDGSIASAFGSSDATPRQRETWLEAGDTKDALGASRVADSSLQLFQNRAVGRTIQVDDGQPTRSLFTDYDVQDWISVEDERFSSHVVKIMAATITVDSETNVSAELTIQTKFEAHQVRTQKTLSKMGASASSGQTATPITGKQSVASSKLSDLSDVNAIVPEDGDILQFDGSQWSSRGAETLAEDLSLSVSELTDVDIDEVLPTDGQVLTYDIASEMWKPATPSGGGGGGGGSSISDYRYTPAPSDVSIDEFNDGILHPSWTYVKHSSIPALPSLANPSYREAAGALSVKYGPETGYGAGVPEGATARHVGLVRPLSNVGGSLGVGDAIYTAFVPMLRNAANYRMCGIVLSTTDGPTGNQFYFRWGTPANFGLRSMTSWGGDTSLGVADYNYGAYATALSYSRIVRMSATTWRGDVSPDGVNWILGNSAATWAFEPTHVGFAESNWNTNTPSVVSYQFLRRQAGVL